jgi:hypothetical protein
MKKPGQEASRKILISCNDATRLFVALGSLEQIFSNKRYSLSVTMLEPKFDSEPKALADAQASAVENARRKAEAVAGTAGIRLGSVIQIEEIDTRTGRSGMYGDEEWRGTLAAGGSRLAVGEEGERLMPATRTKTVRYRIRFAVAERNQ